MAGTSTKTKVIGVRAPIALAAEWERQAASKGIPVSTHVLDLATRGTEKLVASLVPLGGTDFPTRAPGQRIGMKPKRAKP